MRKNDPGPVELLSATRTTFLALRTIFIPQCIAVESSCDMSPAGSKASNIESARLNYMVKTMRLHCLSEEAWAFSLVFVKFSLKLTPIHSHFTQLTRVEISGHTHHPSSRRASSGALWCEELPQHKAITSWALGSKNILKVAVELKLLIPSSVVTGLLIFWLIVVASAVNMLIEAVRQTERKTQIWSDS